MKHTNCKALTEIKYGLAESRVHNDRAGLKMRRRQCVDVEEVAALGRTQRVRQRVTVWINSGKVKGQWGVDSLSIYSR